MIGSLQVSLNQKILIILVSASVVFSTVLSVIYCVVEHNHMQADAEKSYSQRAQTFADGIASALFNADRSEMERFTATAFNDEFIESVVVKNVDGEVEYSQSEDISLKQRGSDIRSASSVDVHTVVGQIVYSGENLGSLELRYWLSGHWILRPESWLVFFGFLLSSLFVATLLLIFIRSHFLHPLKRAAAFTKRISMTRVYYERLPEMGRPSEMGTLYASVNELLCAIEDGHRRMENYAGELESIVTLRTEQLNRRANFDELTGLANRYQLMDRLDESLAVASQHHHMLALFLIDLDRFKMINDTHGHDVGDLVLKEVSQRISEVLLPNEVFARLGGDEFVLVAPDLQGEEQAIAVARRVQSAISSDAYINKLELSVSASMGISFYPQHGKSASELLKYADVSMYSSKGGGRSSYCVYSSVRASHDRRIQIECALPRALDRGEFELCYQPQYSIPTGEISGFEALLRWKNIELNDPQPLEFIPIASETVHIHEITRWVIERAVEDIAVIHSAGLPAATMAVNVSPVTLQTEALKTLLLRMSRREGLARGSIELEINEDTSVSELATTQSQMAALQEMGVRLAIDDFGSQSSSLMNMADLPLDTLKLDGVLVSKIPTSEKHRNMVVAIISLAHGLGLRVVAKGVENEAQYQFLTESACDLVQGNYMQEPVRREALFTLLAQQKQGNVQCFTSRV